MFEQKKEIIMKKIKIKITKKQALLILHQDSFLLLPILNNVLRYKREISYYLVSTLDVPEGDVYRRVSCLWLPVSVGFVYIEWKGDK